MPVREAGLECEARFTNGGPTARFVLIELYASPEPHPKGTGYRCIHKIIPGKREDLTPPLITSLASPHRPLASDSSLESRRREYL